MTRSWIAAAALAVVLAASSGSVMAAPGGGGGSMGGGSSSGMDAPRGADPAKAYQEGIAALRAGNFSDAVPKLRIAADAAPNEGAIQYAYGLALVGNGDHRQARRPFERAVRRDHPLLAEARQQLGLVYLQLSEPAKALEQLATLATDLAACAAPACDDARRQRLQKAHDALKQAIDAGAAPAAPTTGWILPGPEAGRAAYAEGVGLVNQARYAEARAAFLRTQDSIGPHPDVLNYLGFTNRKLGDYAEAQRYYAAALAIDPDHRGATEYLGELYLEMGRLADARQQLAKLDALCPYGCAEREELSRWIAAGR